MQIVANSIIQPSDLVFLGFKEVRNKVAEEVKNLLFEQMENVLSVVLTDYNNEKHIFFIIHEQQELKYFRPFNEPLDSILFSVN